MLIKKINNINYFVNENEFNIIHHNEFNNLKIIDKLGYFETIISFINKISYQHDLIFYDTTHGGFIPLNCSQYYKHIFILCNDLHFDNIIKNYENMNLYSKMSIHTNLLEYNKFNNYILYDELLQFNTELFKNYNFNIIISKQNVNNFSNYIKYHWTTTNLFIYVNYTYNTYFCELFKYFLFNDKMTLHYDNLNNLCIMVKNAGPQFEQMLHDNINYFDKWTILDTGSTDETIDIINRTLVGKKYGNLYCEPFINFKDSRNRLIELAGNECKYITMLDDTYVIDGDLRNFLKEVRGDQYSNSFTLYISSDDNIYGSNRIIRSDSELKYIYRIHEVITDKNNINVIIPENKVKIIDKRFNYMEKRTMERKQQDLKLLFEELEENLNNPRTYYYLAQTYNLLENYEKAYYYFLKRIEFMNVGFIQERYDSAFEAGRIANFKLNKSWDECLKLYEKAIQIDDSRPDAYYFIGIHYYLENNYQIAYKYFKIGFELGFPLHCQYSLKPTLSYHFLPKFLTRVCYSSNNYKDEEFKLGLKASTFFLQNNKSDAEDYQEMLSWYNIFLKLNEYEGDKTPIVPNKHIFCFVADGGFNKWSGSSIQTIGVGGSETYIIEMARYIQQLGEYDVYVFCNCQEEEIFEGVKYKYLSTYSQFIYTNYVKHVIVSRYSEYLPLTFDGWSENVYLVVHDLTPSGIVIPINNKLKNIFCLTEWHVTYMENIFPTLKHLLVPFYYGIDPTFTKVKPKEVEGEKVYDKIKNSFIYSSFANRGLLLLLQMWPKIYNLNNSVSLNIYCDLDNQWVNNVAREQILEIKRLLNLYKQENNSCYNIFYYGWVSKSVLCEAWKKADIWFYPCIFMETFCLTALEAAASFTLAIGNDLAALQNTVADRGIIISGDPTTQQWQQIALEKISLILNDDNFSEQKNNLIKKNYDWAINLSWKNQASNLINNYISVNKLEYKGIYNWTNDIPSGSRKDFLNIINHFNTKQQLFLKNRKIKILEIGTYTGISLINIVKNIPNSIGYGIDKWENYEETKLSKNINNLNIPNSFYHNLRVEGVLDRIIVIQEKLINMIKNNNEFDFIYINGSHSLLNSYSDLILSWELLSNGGILIIDDYSYNSDELNILISPLESVKHFMKLYEGKYNLLLKNYCVFLEKI
jgi:hypothetical protein